MGETMRFVVQPGWQRDEQGNRKSEIVKKQ